MEKIIDTSVSKGLIVLQKKHKGDNVDVLETQMSIVLF